MSFSSDVKNEIVAGKPLRLRHKKAQAYGLLLYAKSFTESEVSLHTESAEIAELYSRFIREFAGEDAVVTTREQLRRGKPLYVVSLQGYEQRRKLLEAFDHKDIVNEGNLPTPEQEHLFLSGAWLACGNITDPQKSYHMEFVCKDKTLSDALKSILDRCTDGAGETVRRGAHVLYFKECAEIEDLLTLMGASKSSLAMIEVEIIKDVRNKANRVTNCETANIDKTVSASTAQVEDIQLIFEVKGPGWLPENLRQVALLRLENPDLSLRELAALSPDSISRSGMHHRLDKLSRLAAALREKGEEKRGG